MKKRRKRSDQGLLPVREILKDFDQLKNKYISREFQDYGYRLAEELGDLKHRALYIKLAKETPRQLLEEARNFVKSADKVRSRARLFMWKLKELRELKSEEQKKEK
jgi:hypothetical protein